MFCSVAIFCSVVFVVADNIRISSLQSFAIDLYAVSSMYFVSFNKYNQYSVSEHSLYAMYILDRKSDFVIAQSASDTFAPILVPDRRTCFDRTNSLLLLHKNLYRLIMRIANAVLLVSAMFSLIALCSLLFALPLFTDYSKNAIVIKDKIAPATKNGANGI